MPLGPLMIDIDGTTLTEEDKTLLANPCVGGLIYFSRNFESAEQITQLSAEIKAIRPELLIAVDQEGGRVQRFKTGFTRIPAMQRFLPLYRKNAEAALRVVEDCGWLMASELIAVGVDFSFAPVLDLDDSQCKVIADRSFSPKPDEASALAGAFIKGMHSAGMAATGKHFPGHGSVLGDSHQVLPQDDRDFTTIAQHDLIPFAHHIHTIEAVMPAHIVFPKVDDAPVGFSRYWLQQVLRQDLGFKGVIFSDDLTMEGAAFAGDYPARAKAALSAGCDMALVCNSRAGVRAVLDNMSLSDWSDQAPVHRQRLSAMSSSSVTSLAALKRDDRALRIKPFLQAITGDS